MVYTTVNESSKITPIHCTFFTGCIFPLRYRPVAQLNAEYGSGLIVTLQTGLLLYQLSPYMHTKHIISHFLQDDKNISLMIQMQNQSFVGNRQWAIPQNHPSLLSEPKLHRDFVLVLNTPKSKCCNIV